MPPFAAFWEGADIREKTALGLLNEKDCITEKGDRLKTKTALTAFLNLNGFINKAGNGTRAAFKACLAFLSSSVAHTVLLNIEDLWQETKAQNIPGTGLKYPSWQRKARYGARGALRFEGC